MRELPSGTVTFLFTDIEGSTRLLHELGAEGYAEALAEHRRVLREAFAAHGGVEVDTQGDAFFVAFPTAPGALAAARDAQQTLTLPVRMGIHTGTPLLAKEGYIGIDVHRATRIAAAGHGGQVLVSASAAALVDADLLGLGEHRFKDLGAPERIYQLGQRAFPALKSLYRSNLPVAATPFLGRRRELSEVIELLSREGIKLLTLTGAGGTGKTRLAIQAAAEASDRYPDGVWWVSLASVRGASLVLESTARVLETRLELSDYIGDRRMLVLYDNFEHLMSSAPDVAGLLGACPRLDVLVTSREPLHLAGEQEYPVLPLAAEEAVDFFLARARAARPNVEADETVAEICRRLDGLPLAIELAAARVRALSPRQILGRLKKSLALLTGGARDAPERQRTLRSTIEWSYELLTPLEQLLFCRLAVFAGGCTLEEAERVAGADVDAIQSLVEKSLIRQGAERYWMLETIGEYALERLEESGELGRCQQALALDVAARLDATDRAAAEFHTDTANWRSAAEWALASGDAELTRTLVLGGGAFHPTPAEQLTWIERAMAETPQPPGGRGQLLRAAAHFHFMLDDLDNAFVAAAEGVELLRANGPADDLVRALASLGLGLIRRGEMAGAERAMEEALQLASEQQTPRGMVSALHGHAVLDFTLGDIPGAQSALERALEVARGDAFATAWMLRCLGDVALERGDIAAARRFYADGAREALKTRLFPSLMHCATGLAVTLASEGHTSDGGRLWGAAAALSRERGVPASRTREPTSGACAPSWTKKR